MTGLRLLVPLIIGLIIVGGWIDETSASAEKCYECRNEADCENPKEVPCDTSKRSRRDVLGKHDNACFKWTKDGKTVHMSCTVKVPEDKEGCDDQGRCICFTDLCNRDFQ